MDNQVHISEINFLGSGWSFPVTFSAANHQLSLTAYESNIKDSIDVILQTNKGERCLEPQFGSGLQQFFFRKMDEALKGEIADVVKAALLFNEPRITVKQVDVEFVDILKGFIQINLVYEFNQTNTRHNYVFPFYINEGTNVKK